MNTKRPLLILALCALLSPAGTARTASDTLSVDEARVVGPTALRRPYMTDSLNLRREAFSAESYLAQNAALVFADTTDGAVRTGEALSTSDDLPTLRVLRFTLRTQRFTPAMLLTPGMNHVKVYVDGQETTPTLKLPPGEVRVDLLCLSLPEATDTFRVSLVGDSLAGLQVNATGKRPFMPRDILYGRKYADVTISPTGKYISYCLYDTKPDGKAAYTTYLRETQTQRLVRQFAGRVRPNWLYGRDLYSTTRDNGLGSRDLFAIDPETGAETCLAARIPDGDFELPATADYLIYRKEEKGPDDLPGTKRIIDPDDRMPGWRNRQALYKYDIATRTYERLTYGAQTASLNDISADGNCLLLSFSTMKPERTPFERSTFVLLNVRTGRVDTLLRDTAFVSRGQFSPDGKQVAFSASPQAFGGIGSEVKPGQIPNGFDLRLYLYDIATRTTRPLLRGFAPSVGRFLWAAGDGNLYFQATDGCDENLFRLNPKTDEVTKYALPLTYIQQFDLAYAAKRPAAIFYGQSGDRSRDLYVASLEKASPKARRVGEQSFEQWAHNLSLPACRNWSFRASRGDTVRAFYYLPQDFDSLRSYPMITYYYGGCTPTGKVLEGFWPLAALANMGYVVLVLEPSGAIGYGQEFAARHVGTWGDESGDDILEGVEQFAREKTFVNPERIGCMGASYGGFMTQYLLTRTDRFRCAISHAGISDLTGYWGGGYWGYTYGETAEYGSFPWNRPDLFVEHSPLYNADKVHTPLLLLHGTADTNVPTNQSQAMYTALRILGRPVAYVTFEGDNHVITDFKKRQAWQQIINAWFAKWLQDDDTWWDTLYPGDTLGEAQSR